MSLSDCKFVWKNGTILPWELATLHVSSHGLHYGTGAFEGIRCYNTTEGPAVFRLGAHLDRWFASAKLYAMEWRYTRQDLVRAVLQVVGANEFSNCYIRPIAFYGSHSLSLNPQGCPVEVVILAWPWETYLGNEALECGIHATLSTWRKFPSAAMPATAKACGQYLNSVLATREAAEGGFDEAILLDDRGDLTEGPGENLFLVRGGHLYTNDEQSSILPGITRDSVIRLAKDLGFSVHIQQLQLDDLITADEAFFTGTAAEVTPIAAVDHQQIGEGTRGPVTTAIQQAFLSVVYGHNPRYLDWLTFVTWVRGDGEPNGKPGSVK